MSTETTQPRWRRIRPIEFIHSKARPDMVPSQTVAKTSARTQKAQHWYSDHFKQKAHSESKQDGESKRTDAYEDRQPRSRIEAAPKGGLRPDMLSLRSHGRREHRRHSASTCNFIKTRSVIRSAVEWDDDRGYGDQEDEDLDDFIDWEDKADGNLGQQGCNHLAFTCLPPPQHLNDVRCYGLGTFRGPSPGDFLRFLCLFGSTTCKNGFRQP
ncbi:hypothetical protein BDZ89DRAFT_1048963 [Hymenopellis radicata]|nr:hypothetical protein BDZ89DRAFT_1048963 [Hymenopellis radicata]